MSSETDKEWEELQKLEREMREEEERLKKEKKELERRKREEAKAKAEEEAYKKVLNFIGMENKSFADNLSRKLKTARRKKSAERELRKLARSPSLTRSVLRYVISLSILFDKSFDMIAINRSKKNKKILKKKPESERKEKRSASPQRSSAVTSSRSGRLSRRPRYISFTMPIILLYAAGTFSTFSLSC